MIITLLHKLSKGFIIFIIAGFLCLNLKSQIVLPWTEGFESIGSVKTYTTSTDSINGLYDWSFEQSTTGQVRFNFGSGFYHTGNAAATLGTSTDGSGDISKIILELDLSLYRNSTDLELSFYYMDHGDPTSSTDAVYIKSGTSDYVLVYSLIPGLRTDGTYTYVNIDLDQEFANAGLKLGSEVFIKFSVNSKYRTYSTTTQGGITFDDISITGSMPPVLLPWIEGFEGIKDNLTLTSNKTNINGRGNISYQKTLNGRLRFNAGSGFCHSGSRAATLDCDAYNSLLPNNMLLITLNMSRYVDYTDLELSFSYMQHGEEPHMFDKVYIRGSSSNTWVEAYDLYANREAAGTWKDVTDIDIDALLLAAGQSISSTFQIAFSQVDDYPAATTTGSDGITIDDIRITTNDRYWIGTHGSYLDDADSWYPLIGTEGSFSNTDLIIRSIILAEAEAMPRTKDYCLSQYFQTLIIEEDAELLLYRNPTIIHQIIIENDFVINGCLKNYDYYPGNFIYIYGDLIVNGSVITLGGYNYGDSFKLYGNFYNNGYFDPQNSGISFYGPDKKVIGGTAPIGMRFMGINVGNSDFDAVEFTNSSNELSVNFLAIERGCLEINSNANLKIGYLYLLADAGLNLNDGNIRFTLTKRLNNYNTSVSITNGISSSVTNNFCFDFEDNENYNWLMFGNGTHAGTQLYNVKFLNTAGESEPKFELRSDMLVQNNLYLDGAIIVADTNEVIIQNTASDAIKTHGTTSYVYGNLRRYVSTGSYDFPVGSDTHYQLATVDIASTSGGLTYLDARFTATDEETPPPGLNVNDSEITEFLNSGYWTITPNAGFAEYNITLTSRGHTNGGGIPEQHAAFKRSIGDWESIGVHDNATQTGSGSEPITVERASLTGFSDFIIGKSLKSFPLPVELVEFSASCIDNSVKISWKTLSEVNNDYFTIEKSSNGKDFFEIHRTNGCGNCNQPISYEYMDNSDNNNFYRLKQTDFDGSVNYSEIIYANCTTSFYNEINCFTSNSGKLCIEFQIPNDNKYKLALFDSAGKLVFNGEISDDFSSSYIFDISDLSSGIYYLNIYNNLNSISKKLSYYNF
ncbi:MAG TPA: T9SS type A sorting domain-containing protein [Bacteroidales bacterium]|nr:T9SS type A sorting domain-containing protein [Bacteroidales bacterium]